MATDPAAGAREFKRRLGDSTPYVLAGAPFGAEALMGHAAAPRHRQGRGASRSAARQRHADPSRQLGRVQARPPPGGRPARRCRRRRVDVRARGRRPSLRPPRPARARPVRRRLRLRRRDVRRRGRAQRRGRARTARHARRAWSASAGSTSITPCSPTSTPRSTASSASSTALIPPSGPGWPGCGLSARPPRKHSPPTPRRRCTSPCPGSTRRSVCHRGELEQVHAPAHGRHARRRSGGPSRRAGCRWRT